MKYLLTFLLVFILIFFDLNAQWKNITPEGGTIQDISIDNQILYSCGTSKNIFISTNSGNYWDSFDTKLSSSEFFWHITNFDNDIFISTIKAVYKSTDNGKSWEKKNSGLPVIDENSQYINIASPFCISDNIIYVVINSRLFKSVDEGETWIEIKTENFDHDATTVLVKDNYIFAGGYGGYFYYSTDYGNTWLRNKPDSNLIEVEINSIALYDNNLFIGNSAGGLFKSTDFGKSWNYLYSFNDRIFSIAVKGNAIAVTVYNRGFFISTNGGENWLNKNYGLPFKRINKAGFMNNNIYIATSKGIFFTTDLGNSWESKNNGINHIHILNVDANDGNLVIGTYLFGSYISKNNGKTWESLNIDNNSYNNSISNIVIDGNVICAGFDYGNVYISTDLGKNWVSSNQKILSKYVKHIVIKDSTIFVGTDIAFYKSTDFGKNWINIRSSDSRNFTFYDNNIFVCSDKAVLKSTNKGKDWDSLYQFNSIITSIDNSNEKIFIGTNDSGIYVSDINGKNWVKTNSGLNNVNNIYCINGIGKYIFVGAFGGIFFSSDAGDNWVDINNDLEYKWVNNISFNDNYIFASTVGGIYRAKLSDFGITDVSANQIEKYNYLYSYPPYPIPAQNIVNTLIYWDTSIDIDNDKIDILDIFGNKIGNKKDIVINKQSPYSGILTWNCSGVSNGIYFILINHGTEKQAIKVIVNK